ncbi:TPA: acyltransferase family protein [Staphylococcus pseudintermedius]|uniref:acyltransferase family protein n=2 Tax=Staphylococcus pseudintermedius TaxID=283734 RepID=UPI001032A465|nr:acyltransferase family protein [Staphylococcus pseudintermedius]EGQ0357258.1 acetyltransferase [Staphylococcus pseudintermedius]EGQ0360103.1 acetyltransferase [Staphylococcus pseudintermedius]EGQ1295924.1 acyltransferase family protein [Staphylococcus pseudintermedius]EGQ1310095.1 acyltransferase family protein [Staphylococcus pseudintermedius]EGQ2716496.1 acetyltransferase [Staphylococcus pseudintermedius]
MFVWNFNQRDRKPINPRYMPGLDGVRAVAVIAIIIYHLNPQWLSGGFLGVDTFFVISGYLITSLLLTEYHNTGKIELMSFWLRRVKRLIPAVLFLVMGVIVLSLIFMPTEIQKVRADSIAAIFYVSNWWYIMQNVDYFEQFAVQPLKHLWSLAIEEQFYLVFPIVLLSLLSFIRRLKSIRIIFLILLVISMIAMMVLYVPNENVARVYFGTDTRIQTLLMGVLLALVWPPFQLKAKVNRQMRTMIDTAGVVGLAILFICFKFVSETNSILYYGGFFLISTVTLLVIASSVHPSGYFAKFLGNKVFTFIGSRSYSLYLWHYPIIVLIHHQFVQGQIPPLVYVVEILLMVLMAEFSYKFIEQPFRKEGFNIFAFNHLKNWRSQKVLRTWLVIILLIPTLLVMVGSFNRFAQKNSTRVTEVNTEEIDKLITQPLPLPQLEIDGFVVKGNKQKYASWKPLLIGDSVMVDIGDDFRSFVPKADINGKVGRQLVEATSLAKRQYQSYRDKNDIVVLELGTNGDFTEEQLNSLLEQFGEADIYLVNTRVPRSYESHVNQVLAKAAKKRANVTLVDWYSRSENHTEYFAPDGIHLQPPGVRALTNSIIQAIEKNHGTKKKNK